MTALITFISKAARRVMIASLLLASLGASTIESIAETTSAGTPAGEIAAGDSLDSGTLSASYGTQQLGSVTHSVLEASYSRRIGPLTAPEGYYLVMLKFEIRNSGHMAFRVDNLIDIRVEDGPQHLPGWDVERKAMAELKATHPYIGDASLEPEDSAVGYSLFVVPEGTKNLWCHVMSKEGASLEKKWSGGHRRLLGDLPGDDWAGTGALGQGMSTNKGYVGVTIERSFFLVSAEGIEPPEDYLFVVIEAVVRNHDDKSHTVRELCDIRLEDPPQDLPGWDVDEATALALNQDYPFLYDMVVEKGGQVTGFCVYVVPEGTKDLWCNVRGKCLENTQKVWAGCSRWGIGDLPGEEQVRDPAPRYRSVIGTFRIRDNALRWAAMARSRGLTAWVETSQVPEGLFIVVTGWCDSWGEAMDATGVAKEHGYLDSYVISPAR